jgi:hypothetical protein
MGPKRSSTGSTKKEPIKVDKNAIVESATLETKADIDNYIDKLKTKLYGFLKDGGVKID